MQKINLLIEEIQTSDSLTSQNILLNIKKLLTKPDVIIGQELPLDN